jgi:hypothetical protein
VKHIEYVYPGYSSGGKGNRPSDAAEREVRPKNTGPKNCVLAPSQGTCT